MQHHILEEEDRVFPAFDGVMDPEVDMSIHEQSQRFMEENLGASLADMEAFANKLQDRVMGKGVIKYGP